MAMTDVAERRKRQEKAGGWAETVRTVVYAVLIALVVRTFAIEPFNIPSGSMIPTLLVGDYLFVDPGAYADGRQPAYGDIIAFVLSSDRSRVPVVYIKRVVGLPGDRLGLDGGVLRINGKAMPQQPSGDFMWLGRTIRRLREQTPGGIAYEILRVDRTGPLNTVGPYVVPEGSYFVLGDNRDNSLDSRSWNEGRGGFIPRADIIGRANYIYWSGFERLGRIGVTLK